MTTDDTRMHRFRSAIDLFIGDRLAAKLDGLDPESPKLEELKSHFEPASWLEDAARRARQIQLVTHALKPMHPDARGTNLYCPADALAARDEVGTHSLRLPAADDVVGNAAALDVYKFLKIEIDGKTLLRWLQEHDADLLAALGADLDRSNSWADAFRSIAAQDLANPASHTNAKQVYWLTSDDPSDDESYVLLAPLYASSFAHAVYQRINADRFSDEAKAARQAMRDGAEHATGFAKYPDLAIQKLGGTKPQNISQLNSERRGENYLLASLPPHWRSRDVREPFHTESVFGSVFARRRAVRELLGALRSFLRSDPDPNLRTRSRVERYLDELIDELLAFATELQQALSPGWSAEPDCRLVEAERLWLDPGRASIDAAFRDRWLGTDWAEMIGARFGNWLNDALGKDLRLGEVEARHWKDELLADERAGGWAGLADRHQRALIKATHNAAAEDPA